ncbi:MAG: cytochrome c family protein [Proteobacteria bacterium]|nr:cytochrome c family protein [Pseudomonadota bacterium]
MDSFEFNKIAAAILIALLTIKGAELISDHLVQPKMLKENVYKIEGVSTTAATGEAAAEKKGPVPIEPLLASANVQKGADVFKKCTSCHTIDAGGPNRVGPNLHNIVGAQKAHHPGYSYSQAMTSKGGTWSYDDLNIYLYSPRDFVPGTKMSFAGVKNDQERADLIAYLRQQTDNPPPIPDVKAAPDASQTPLSTAPEQSPAKK